MKFTKRERDPRGDKRTSGRRRPLGRRDRKSELVARFGHGAAHITSATRKVNLTSGSLYPTSSRQMPGSIAPLLSVGGWIPAFAGMTMRLERPPVTTAQKFSTHG